eukprot:11165020-Lingulodinium_polyedra.AAC.1
MAVVLGKKVGERKRDIGRLNAHPGRRAVQYMEQCRPSDARTDVKDEKLESSADPGVVVAAGSSIGT